MSYRYLPAGVFVLFKSAQFLLSSGNTNGHPGYFMIVRMILHTPRRQEYLYDEPQTTRQCSSRGSFSLYPRGSIILFQRIFVGTLGENRSYREKRYTVVAIPARYGPPSHTTASSVFTGKSHVQQQYLLVSKLSPESMLE